MTELEAGHLRAGTYVRVRGWAIRRLARNRQTPPGAHSWRTRQLPAATTTTTSPPAAPPDTDLQVGHGWSAGAHWAATAVRTSVWIAVVCGPIALIGVLIGGPSAPPVVQAAPVDATVSERAAVGEFAERYVTTWVETDSDNVGRLKSYVQLPDTLSWPTEAGGEAGAAEVSGIGQQPTGLWSVTVGTDVTAAGTDTVKRRYFQVAISYDGGAMVAAGLPTPVPAPPTAEPPEPAYGSELMVDSAAGETIADFLRAMLAGRGDIARYVSPGSGIEAISSAPYRDVRIEYIDSDVDLMADSSGPSDGETANVLVTAKAQTDNGAEMPVQYALSLRSRDGRWEVSAVGQAPLTDEAASNGPSTGSVSGTSSSLQEDTP
ncbi:MAG: conjugal transfer protein [Nocardioidaceae bacterium]